MFARPTRYNGAGRAIINKLKQAGPGPELFQNQWILSIFEDFSSKGTSDND
jgi:hypothetical protein